MSKYTLNTDLARASDQGPSRINETGQYVGKFTSAIEVTSKNKTKGIELSFESIDGQTCDYLTLWTEKENGEEVFGLRILNSIMTCLQLREITTATGKVERYNKETKSKYIEEMTTFPALMNKPIGLLLQRETYDKYDNTQGHKMNIFGSFSAASKLMASEILDKKTTPEKLAKVLLTLKDRTSKPKVSAPNQTDYAPTPPDFGNDIPW